MPALQILDPSKGNLVYSNSLRKANCVWRSNEIIKI